MEDYFNSYLKCTGCGKDFFFDGPRHNHTYTRNTTNQLAFSKENNPICEYIGLPRYSDSKALALLVSPCWCLGCNTASFVERVPDIEQYIKAAALRKLPVELRPRDIHDRLLDLYDEGFDAHFKWRMTRTAAPKCLNCGYSAYILIDEDKRETGITHEDCWNSPIELHYLPVGSGIYRPRIDCYHALSGEVNWIHIHESAAFSCMTDHPCQADLREAAYAIIRKDTVPALDILQSLAKDDIPAAMTGLGGLYQTGMGVEPDGNLALHYLSKGLAAGDGIAAANLVGLYRFGAAGIDRNEETAWSYARIASKMGIFLF